MKFKKIWIKPYLKQFILRTSEPIDHEMYEIHFTTEDGLKSLPDITHTSDEYFLPFVDLPKPLLKQIK